MSLTTCMKHMAFRKRRAIVHKMVIDALWRYCGREADFIEQLSSSFGIGMHEFKDFHYLYLVTFTRIFLGILVENKVFKAIPVYIACRHQNFRC